MVVTVVAFFIRDGLGLNIPLAFFLVFYALSFILIKAQELLLFFFFLIPLSVGPLLYFVNVVFGLCYILKNINTIRINKVIRTSFFLVLWEAVHLLSSTILGYDESIIKFLGFSLCLFVAVICISRIGLECSYKNLIFSWCLGFASFCGILLFKYILQYGISNFAVVVRRFGWVPGTIEAGSTNLLINPNALGKLVILTVFCLLTVLQLEKKFTMRISSLIMYFVTFGILSGSRGFALVGIILLFFYGLEIILNIKKNKRLALILAIAAVVIFLFAVSYMQTTLEMFSSRIASQDISGSRFDIYQDYIKVLSSSLYLVFGSGMQEYPNKFQLNISSHNFFIEVISIWGVIGLLLVSLWFVSLYNSMNITNSMYKRTVLPYLPLLCIFLTAQIGQFFISYYNTFPTLMLAFLNIKYAYLKIDEIDKQKGAKCGLFTEVIEVSDHKC